MHVMFWGVKPAAIGSGSEENNPIVIYFGLISRLVTQRITVCMFRWKLQSMVFSVCQVLFLAVIENCSKIERKHRKRSIPSQTPFFGQKAPSHVFHGKIPPLFPNVEKQGGGYFPENVQYPKIVRLRRALLLDLKLFTPFLAHVARRRRKILRN